MSLYNSKQARKMILKGAKKLYSTVSSTFGSSGSNVLIIKPISDVITNDGFSIASNINSKCRVEQSAINTLRDVSSGAESSGGDGTTNSVVLGYHMLKEGFKYIDKGSKPIDIKRQILEVKDYVLRELELRTKKAEFKDLKNVATISANNDTELGDLVFDAYNAVGFKGNVVVKPNRDVIENFIELSDGAVFPASLASPNFIERGEVSVIFKDGADILMTDITINSMTDITYEDGSSVLESYAKTKEALVLVVNSINPIVIQNLAISNTQHGTKFYVVNSAFFGIKKLGFYQDLAALTHSTYLSEEGGFDLSKIKYNSIGYFYGTLSLENLVVTMPTDEETLEAHVEDLYKISEKGAYTEKQGVEERIDNLSKKLATINVCGESELEMREAYLRVEDSVNAVRHAYDTGIVVGGGRTLGDIGKNMVPTSEGAEIVKYALMQPQKIIMKNYGGDPSRLDSLNPNVGIDTNTGLECDFLKVGIVDPHAIIKSSFINALSNISTLLSVNYVVIESDVL